MNILARCDFEIFVALKLVVDCIIFLLKDFRPDPTISGI